MVRVIFFDLGGTLTDARRRPYPHAADAVRTIGEFRADDGKALRTALVSDFDMAAPPATPAKIKPIFSRYLAILDQAGLLPLFEPVDRRVSLSTHAGVTKPDAKIFRTALTRLRVPRERFDRCCLVTEDAGHIAAVKRTLHMQALRFGASSTPGVDFTDWRELPALLARLTEAEPGPNARVALTRFLHETHAIEIDSIDPERTRGRDSRFAVAGSLWVPVPAGRERVWVPFPTKGTVTGDARGAFRDVRVTGPSPNEIAEAERFVRSLVQHEQLRTSRGREGVLGRSATHVIEIDDQGRRKLVRKRFSAL